MVALGGGSENDFEIGSQATGDESLDHFVVSSGMEDMRLLPKSEQLAEGDDRDVVGQMVFPKDGERDSFPDLGKSLQHGGSHAGKARIGITKNDERV